MNFPKNFAWGSATAAHQVEGNNTNNNWYQWENSLDHNSNYRIINNQKSGLAADHWNRYPEDIKLMKDLGLTHYRFSVEWSKVEPSLGQIDSSVIEHYKDLCDSLILNDITPVVTLHHFTNPIWFENLGAFEKEENISYFINFSKIVFKELNNLVPIWCTINEPAVYVAQGYFNGIFPPGKKDPNLAGLVTKNMLNAHVLLYHELKRMKGGNTSQIGIVKNIFQFDPLRRWNIIDWIASNMLNNVYTNDPINFFKTGTFNFILPGADEINFENELAINSLDFIGLNYYSRMHIKGHLNTKEPFTFEIRNQDKQTDMHYSIYPEGFYRALKTINKLNVPIYVTENGVADKNDSFRSEFISKYLFSMHRALSEGIDIRGYFYWSLMDNFEWAEGYKMKFGLYSVDFKTQERTLRKGSKTFVEIINRKGYDDRGFLVSIGDKTPNFTMNFTDGTSAKISDFLGKVVVLQFTASWCSVCRLEMPHLEKDIWQKYKGEDVIIIGIDRDESLETVKNFKKEMKINYPLSLDLGAHIFSLFADKHSGVTRNIVIDQTGKIIFLTRLFNEIEYNKMLHIIKETI
ncbi:MAG: family 1 glycosylhydrolase [Candidatus Neomarinimicrobiota bacterium]